MRANRIMSFERKSGLEIEKKIRIFFSISNLTSKKTSLLPGEIPADEIKLVKKLGEDKSGKMFLATYRKGRVAVKIFNFADHSKEEGRRIPRDKIKKGNYSKRTRSRIRIIG